MLGVLLAAAALGAEDREAPIISLSLGNWDGDDAPHAQHGSASQYADECCDGYACDADGPCRPPTASAFDHHDGDISNAILKTYEVFVESAPGARPHQVDAGTGLITEGEFTANLQANAFRGELVIRYDVSDGTGNHAEQVTYALIMRDTSPPEYLLSLANERKYGGTTPFNKLTVADFKDGYDGSKVKVDLTLTNGDIHHLNADSDPFVISEEVYTCTENSITAEVSDFADIFGKHNLDNKATFQLLYTLVDTTPPTIDISGVHITELECNGADHDIGTISGVHASDESCTCSDSQSQVLVEGNAGVKCAYHCSGPFTQAVTFANNVVGSISITCVAIDYVNHVTSVSPMHGFSIEDHTPPTLNLILHGRQDADAGSRAISHTDAQGNNFVFNLTPRDDISLTPQEALYITDLTIQHHSGYFDDTAIFKDLEQAYQCSDTCTTEIDLQSHSTWHVVDEPTTCENLPAQTNWALVDVARPGTFMIKYTCKDQSNNVESVCRTIFNEGHATAMPTATPTTAPTSMPTSAPTAVPTYMPCDPNAEHDCDLVSTYCGMHEMESGDLGIICACNLGYLPDPESDTSCIATAAPTAAPTHAPSTSYPTSMPTLEIVVPIQTNDSYIEFKLVYMPDQIAYLDEVYDMVQSFIYFWAGDSMGAVQTAVDHYELSLQWQYGGGSNHSRRLRGQTWSEDLEEELRPDGNFMGGVEVKSNGRTRQRTRRARRLEDTGNQTTEEEQVFGVAEFSEGYEEVCPVKDPSPVHNWQVPVILSGNATQEKMRAHARSLGDGNTNIAWVFPDGSTTTSTISADGEVTTTHTESEAVFHSVIGGTAADGGGDTAAEAASTSTDGKTTTVTHADGSTTISAVNFDGSVTITDADGIETTVEAVAHDDGSTTATLDDGTTVTVSEGDICAGHNDNPYMACEPRSSPFTFVLSIKMWLSKENNSEVEMGTFCLKDTVNHILDSNSKSPNFCGDICDPLYGECSEKTVEQYFNELKPKMLSDYYAGLICTTAPTAAPTALPTEPVLPTVPVLNFINQCNAFGPCSTSNDASTCYCVAASLGSVYTDEGAVCSDTIEGDISGAVTVSGDQPDLSQIGTYQVSYTCSTAAGGVATPIVRTVTVFDAVCPTCEVTSHETTTIEASFPYVDQQVLCSDNMNLIPVSASISGEVDVELTGRYTITYSATDESHNTNFLRKYNNSVCNAGLSQTRTVVVIDTLVPVISLHDEMAHYGTMQPVMEQASANDEMWRFVTTTVPFTVGAVALLVARRRYLYSR
jgi:hypothetical protein